ncbi:MAG: 50S ribosomal protein L22 [Flavobacteriaceae bacterium]|jgi:large subunit ribosomal protein L22|nr:50S ribosomal protein L22 [Flavobacteriaceae bacterium]
MGNRKQNSAIARKEAKKDLAIARLNNCPTSPRKMRLVADIIRGVDVDKALYILKYSKKEASNRLEKLLLSAIANWQVKNEGKDVEEAQLFVKEIFVDGGSSLKRLRPAPQGRGYKIRKRSNHVTIILGNKNEVN